MSNAAGARGLSTSASPDVQMFLGATEYQTEGQALALPCSSVLGEPLPL